MQETEEEKAQKILCFLFMTVQIQDNVKEGTPISKRLELNLLLLFCRPARVELVHSMHQPGNRDDSVCKWNSEMV